MTSALRPRPLVGPLLVVVGAIHVGITPLLFGPSVRSVLDGGVLAAVEADPESAELRRLGFWYVTAGGVAEARRRLGRVFDRG